MKTRKNKSLFLITQNPCEKFLQDHISLAPVPFDSKPSPTIQANPCAMYARTVVDQSWSRYPFFVSEEALSDEDHRKQGPLSYQETGLCDRIVALHESNEPNTLQGSADSLWNVMFKTMKHEEENAQFWWTTTGRLLAILLHQAKYPVTTQCNILLFYFSFLVPELGCRPDFLGRFIHWKSFMADSNMPLELSWEWDPEDKSPTVRLSIEPIGLDAGTPTNALNEFATTHLIENIQRNFMSADLRLFYYFSKELLSYNLGHPDTASTAAADHRSRSFLAFDFGRTSIMLKAYFLPAFKARESQVSTLALISQAIAGLAKLGLHFPGFEFLTDYIRMSKEGSRLETEMFAIDCVTPASARMKVYLRSQSTSFTSILSNVTLGGKLRQYNLDTGIAELEKLWKCVLLPARNASADEELPHKAHRTAGILYYYEIKPDQLMPTPRVYIPVRHYGQNDTAISKGLVQYFKTRGQDETSDRYLKAIQTA